VVADDALVRGSRALQAEAEPRDGQPIGAHRDVQETLVNDDAGRFRRALNVQRLKFRQLSVTVDGRALTAKVGGTQTYIIDLITALASHANVKVRVLAPPDLSEGAAAALAQLSNI